jgi:hypothetical protein
MNVRSPFCKCGLARCRQFQVKRGLGFIHWLTTSFSLPALSLQQVPLVRLTSHLQPLRDAPQSHPAFPPQTQAYSYGPVRGAASRRDLDCRHRSVPFPPVPPPLGRVWPRPRRTRNAPRWQQRPGSRYGGLPPVDFKKSSLNHRSHRFSREPDPAGRASPRAPFATDVWACEDARPPEEFGVEIEGRVAGNGGWQYSPGAK